MEQTTEQFDPKILKVFKAIRQIESQGNYDAVGDNHTSYGAFQWNNGKTQLKPGETPENFKNAASKFLGDRNAPMTKTNQNKVAYKQIEEYKNQGMQPEEIAALWNGAHKDKTTGRYTYNNPEYGVKFRNALSGTSEEKKIETPVPATSTQPKKDLLQKATDVVTSVFPGGKVGESIGTLAGYMASSNKEFYDTSAPTPLQVLGDVGQGALMVAPGMGASTQFGRAVPGSKLASSTLGRMAQTTGLGAGMGLTGSLSQGNTDIKTLSKDTLTGGVKGLAMGGLGELANVAGKYGPTAYSKGMKQTSGIDAKKLIAGLLGSPGGVPGMLTTLAMERVMTNPKVVGAVAKTISQLANQQKLAQVVTPYASKKSTK